MRSKRKDPKRHIGYKKGNQEIIEFLVYKIRGNKSEYPYYKCKCNYCKFEYDSFYESISDKRSTGMSCRKCSNFQNKIYKSLSMSDAQISIAYSNYKSKCKIKKLNFELIKPQFEKLVRSNCHYCNQEPNQFRMDRIKSKRVIDGSFLMNGIDRKNNLLGYTIGNSLPCCEDCNKAKRNLSYTQFLRLVSNIYKHLKLH